MIENPRVGGSIPSRDTKETKRFPDVGGGLTCRSVSRDSAIPRSVRNENATASTAAVSGDVSVLYVDPRGPYPQLVSDWWGVERDARLYAGPGPVVVHPPCGPWGRLRHMYKGDEHECAPCAVGQVRRWGGVLKHPAGSLLWAESFSNGDLPYPGDAPDLFGGFTVEVNQCDWGHVARKCTWLYFVGADRADVERAYAARPFPGREPTHWISGGRGRSGKKAKTTPVPPGIKVCSAQQRRRTPPALAEWLICLAAQACPPFLPSSTVRPSRTTAHRGAHVTEARHGR